MKRLTKANWIWIGGSGAVLLLVIIAGLGLFFKKEPNPYALLPKAEGRIAQNLCRLAILEEDPLNEEVQRALLMEYQQHADPLTLHSALQKAEEALGHPIILPEGLASAPSPSKPLAEGGDIAQKGVCLKKFKTAESLASDGTITYLSYENGIYAHYKGLKIKIFHGKVQHMLAAEEGLYFISLPERRVQYLAGDGSSITTLSTKEAADFAYWEDTLYLLDGEGRLWQEDTQKDAPLLTELCTLGDTLYGCGKEGLYRIQKDAPAEQITPSSLSNLTAGEDGKLYYLNEYGYPCLYDPATKTAQILKEKEGISIGQTLKKVYYLDPKGKIRTI